MFRRCPPRRRDGAAILIRVTALGTALLSPVSRAADRDLLLAVEVNGRSLDTVVQAAEQQQVLSIARDDFAALGLRAPPAGPGDRIALRDVQGLAFRIDEPRQMLLIQADDRALLSQAVGGRGAGADRAPDRPGFGALLNYDLFGTVGAGSHAAGLFDARLGTPYGTVSSSGLVQGTVQGAVGGPSGQFGRPLLRLDSSFTHPEFEGGRVWEAGDVIAGALPWTRAFRLGGLQVRTTFAMRPDLIAYPLPSLTGRAAVPSSVDVLVDGVRQLSDTVQSGPFTIRQPPVITGAGEITLATRDVLGQTTTRTLSVYVSPDMLARGLSSYSAETGLLRTGYASPADRYGQPVASVSVRHGVLDWLTAESHAEASRTVGMAGAGLTANVFNQGVMTLAAAVSAGRADTARNPASPSGPGAGWLGAAGLERSGRVVSVAVSAVVTSPRFRDVPAGAGDPVPRSVLRASLGFSLGAYGQLRTAFVASKGGLLPVYSGAAQPVLRVGAARVGSVSYTRNLGERTAFYATAYRDFAQNRSSGALFGITIQLGGARSAALSGSLGAGGPGASLDAIQSAAEIGEVGLRARLNGQVSKGNGGQGNAGQGNGGQAEASYIAPFGTARVGVDVPGARPTGRAELQGTLAYGAGGFFAANRIEDSYAIVDTDGQAGVPVLLENRRVGQTDRSGRLLVTGLRAWGDNRLAIDPTGLPADAETPRLATIVRPPDRSGVVVRFPVRRGASAVIRIVEAPGVPIPVGSPVVLRRTGQHLAVGFGGEVFATDLAGDDTLLVTLPRGPCVARFSFVAQPGEIPVLGPVPCVPPAAP